MKQITKYIIRRVILYLLSLWLSISFGFFIFRILPGNPVYAFVATLSRYGHGAGQDIEKILDSYLEVFGLKQDLWTQYANFWKELILRGNLGPSIINFPNSSMGLILRSLPWSMGLLGISILLSWILGNIIGAFLAWKKDARIDKIGSTISLGLSPFPYYIMALMLMLTVFYLTGTIMYGAYNPKLSIGLSLEFILSVITYGSLPAVSIVISETAGWIISMRSLLVPILGEDYLTFAEAKGLEKRRIFSAYALRNAILPQITYLGMTLGSIMSGSILVETIFNYPGIGKLFQSALSLLDYNTIMGCLVVVMFTVLTANLLIDLLLPLIDPRIRYEGQ